MELYERLRWAREKAGYPSAAEAARVLGVPYGTYSGHENGGRVDRIELDEWTRYARFFKVRAAWLILDEGEPFSDASEIEGDYKRVPDHLKARAKRAIKGALQAFIED